ncbi:MAG TPA: hypothetical protein VMY35_05940 [Phycisphaerae bacterium]|nr:hypothetical protein [Phycisphaerae bacterium]
MDTWILAAAGCVAAGLVGLALVALAAYAMRRMDAVNERLIAMAKQLVKANCDLATRLPYVLVDANQPDTPLAYKMTTVRGTPEPPGAAPPTEAVLTGARPIPPGMEDEYQQISPGMAQT